MEEIAEGVPGVILSKKYVSPDPSALNMSDLDISLTSTIKDSESFHEEIKEDLQYSNITSSLSHTSSIIPLQILKFRQSTGSLPKSLNKDTSSSYKSDTNSDSNIQNKQTPTPTNIRKNKTDEDIYICEDIKVDIVDEGSDTDHKEKHTSTNIICEYCRTGVGSTISEISSHLGVCNKLPIKCKYNLCDIYTQRECLEEHENKCIYRDVECQTCGIKVQFLLLDKHKEGCLGVRDVVDTDHNLVVGGGVGDVHIAHCEYKNCKFEGDTHQLLEHWKICTIYIYIYIYIAHYADAKRSNKYLGCLLLLLGLIILFIFVIYIWEITRKSSVLTPNENTYNYSLINDQLQIDKQKLKAYVGNINEAYKSAKSKNYGLLERIKELEKSENVLAISKNMNEKYILEERIKGLSISYTYDTKMKNELVSAHNRLLIQNQKVNLISEEAKAQGIRDKKKINDLNKDLIKLRTYTEEIKKDMKINLNIAKNEMIEGRMQLSQVGLKSRTIQEQNQFTIQNLRYSLVEIISMKQITDFLEHSEKIKYIDDIQNMKLKLIEKDEDIERLRRIIFNRVDELMKIYIKQEIKMKTTQFQSLKGAHENDKVSQNNEIELLRSQLQELDNLNSALGHNIQQFNNENDSDKLSLKQEIFQSTGELLGHLQAKERPSLYKKRKIEDSSNELRIILKQMSVYIKELKTENLLLKNENERHEANYQILSTKYNENMGNLRLDNLNLKQELSKNKDKMRQKMTHYTEIMQDDIMNKNAIKNRLENYESELKTLKSTQMISRELKLDQNTLKRELILREGQLVNSVSISYNAKSTKYLKTEIGDLRKVNLFLLKNIENIKDNHQNMVENLIEELLVARKENNIREKINEKRVDDIKKENYKLKVQLLTEKGITYANQHRSEKDLGTSFAKRRLETTTQEYIIYRNTMNEKIIILQRNNKKLKDEMYLNNLHIEQFKIHYQYKNRPDQYLREELVNLVDQNINLAQDHHQTTVNYIFRKQIIEDLIGQRSIMRIENNQLNEELKMTKRDKLNIKTKLEDLLKKFYQLGNIHIEYKNIPDEFLRMEIRELKEQSAIMGEENARLLSEIKTIRNHLKYQVLDVQLQRKGLINMHIHEESLMKSNLINLKNELSNRDEQFQKIKTDHISIKNTPDEIYRQEIVILNDQNSQLKSNNDILKAEIVRLNGDKTNLKSSLILSLHRRHTNSDLGTNTDDLSNRFIKMKYEDLVYEQKLFVENMNNKLNDLSAVNIRLKHNIIMGNERLKARKTVHKEKESYTTNDEIFRKQIEDLLDESTKNNQRLHAQLKRLKEDKISLKSLLSSLKKGNLTQKSGVTDPEDEIFRQEIEILNDQNSALRVKNDELNKEVDILKTEIVRLNGDKTNLKSSLILSLHRRHTNSDLGTNTDDLSNRFIKMKYEDLVYEQKLFVENMNNKLNDLSAVNIRLKHNIIMGNERLKARKTVHKEKESYTTNDEIFRKQIEDLLDESTKNNQRLHAQLKRLKEDKISLKSLLSSLKKGNLTQKSGVTDPEDEIFRQEIEILNDQNSALRVKNDELNKEVDILKTEIVRLNGDKTNLKSSLILSLHRRHTNSDLGTNTDDLSNRFIKMKYEDLVYEQKLFVENMNNKLNDLSAVNIRLKHNIIMGNERLKARKTVHKEKESYTTNDEIFRKQIEDLLDESTKNNQRLHAQLKRLKEDKISLKSLLSSLKKGNLTQKSGVTDPEDEIFRQEIEILNDQNSALRVKNDELNKEVDILKTEIVRLNGDKTNLKSSLILSLHRRHTNSDLGTNTDDLSNRFIKMKYEDLVYEQKLFVEI